MTNTGKKIIDDSWCRVAGSDVSAAGAASLHQAYMYIQTPQNWLHVIGHTRLKNSKSAQPPQ